MARLVQQTGVIMMETRMDWIHGVTQKHGGYSPVFIFPHIFFTQFNQCASILMNIFTPYLPGNEKPQSDKNLKPVLFWLHGGGSTAMDATYDGVSLASRSDVVLVSINWRGGNFGMSFPSTSQSFFLYFFCFILKPTCWLH